MCRIICFLLLLTPTLALAKHHHHHQHHSIKNTLNNGVQKISSIVRNIKDKVAVALPPDEEKQMLCTAIAIYKEARGISELGQVLVAKTIEHREVIRNLKPCEVVAQPGQFPWLRQISSRWKPSENQAWQKAQDIALNNRYTEKYSSAKFEPSCFIEYFSVGLFRSHRRNLLCSMRVSGHYYYQLKQGSH